MLLLSFDAVGVVSYTGGRTSMHGRSAIWNKLARLALMRVPGA
jgi:hypothetical protein